MVLLVIVFALSGRWPGRRVVFVFSNTLRRLRCRLGYVRTSSSGRGMNVRCTRSKLRLGRIRVVGRRVRRVFIERQK